MYNSGNMLLQPLIVHCVRISTDLLTVESYKFLWIVISCAWMCERSKTIDFFYIGKSVYD